VYLKYPTLSGKYLNQERVFAYEFYHQLRLAFGEKKLYVSGEIKKGIALFSNQNEVTIFPDIIIHKFGNHESNNIAIEIKATPSLTAKEIDKDLDKLIALTKAPFNYPKVIFLSLNCDLCSKINGSLHFKTSIINKIETCKQLEVWNILPITQENKLTKEYIEMNDIREIEIIEK
jgi:hypothetical protein